MCCIRTRRWVTRPCCNTSKPPGGIWSPAWTPCCAGWTRRGLHPVDSTLFTSQRNCWFVQWTSMKAMNSLWNANPSPPRSHAASPHFLFPLLAYSSPMFFSPSSAGPSSLRVERPGSCSHLRSSLHPPPKSLPLHSAAALEHSKRLLHKKLSDLQANPPFARTDGA